jgi:L-glyceraldehyde reductase
MKQASLSPINAPPRSSSKQSSVKTVMYVQPPGPSNPAPIIPPTPPTRIKTQIDATEVMLPPSPGGEVEAAEPGVPPLLLTPLNRKASIGEHRRKSSRASEIFPVSSTEDLWSAVRANDAQAVKNALVNTSVNDPDWKSGGITALHIAGVSNFPEMVKLLLSSGANPDILAGNPSANALHWTCRAGHLDCVKLMLEDGRANPAYLDSQGYNALLLATQGGHEQVVEYLVKNRGFNINFPDSASRTPLIWSAYLGNSKETLDILLQGGADVNASDAQGFTALHWAIGTRHISIAKSLLFAGAWPFVRDKEGYTPEDRARMLGMSGAWTALLKIVELRRGFFGPKDLQGAFSSISTPGLAFGTSVQAKINGKDFVLPKAYSNVPKPLLEVPVRIFTLANGVNVSGICLSLGIALHGVELVDFIVKAVQVGYRHFETSPIYGNEEAVGRGLKRALEQVEQGSLRREHLFIHAKLPSTMHSPSDVAISLQKTLTALQMSFVDLYSLEWPVAFVKSKDGILPMRDENGCVKIDESLSLADCWRAMESLSGDQARAIGVCNFPLEKLRWLVEFSEKKPLVHYYESHPLLPQAEMVSYCRKNEIMAAGYLPIKKLLDDAYVLLVAEKYHASPARILVSRALQRGTIAVIKSSLEKLEENFSPILLDNGDLEVLGTINKRIRFVNPVKMYGVDLFGEGGGEEGFEGKVVFNTIGFEDI